MTDMVSGSSSTINGTTTVNGTTYNNISCNENCDCNSSGNGSDTSSGGSGSDTTNGGSGSDTNSGSSGTTGIPDSLSNFTDAITAQNKATPWTTINTEIQNIESLITTAIGDGKFQIFVTGTYMTSQPTGLPYFRVHFDEDEWLNTPYDQMNIHYQIREVKQNFTNLGYDFEIVQNPNLPNTLMFIITW